MFYLLMSRQPLFNEHLLSKRITQTSIFKNIKITGTNNSLNFEGEFPYLNVPLTVILHDFHIKHTEHVSDPS